MQQKGAERPPTRRQTTHHPQYVSLRPARKEILTLREEKVRPALIVTFQCANDLFAGVASFIAQNIGIRVTFGDTVVNIVDRKLRNRWHATGQS